MAANENEDSDENIAASEHAEKLHRVVESLVSIIDNLQKRIERLESKAEN